MSDTASELNYQRTDFVSSAEQKWCPACGLYPILKGVTNTFKDLGIRKENFALISGIGCSSRFPYYVDTYGFHTIHGRAPALATGLELMRPDLSVWIVSGDGDCLSIGGNHFIHTMRRNPNVNYLLMNNEIYGLTKGQTSPTSKKGVISKTTPYGHIDPPMAALPLAIAAGATFVARVLDADLKAMKEVFTAAHQHKGTSFVEVYFNCITFADKVFENYASKKQRPVHTVEAVAGQPLVFGENNELGIRQKGFGLEVVEYEKEGLQKEDLVIHDPTDKGLAMLLTKLDQPVALGILRQVEQPSFGDLVREQNQTVIDKKGPGDLAKLLKGNDYWTV
ncbi:MAG: 2-oxoacid:ferredoxin oxidoreductase subunit beta [Bdellovibrionales bacterium]|nr:2-oxoacid:ferredoxin oxidoreductase subunit beta [Bdellovibrionales bacterium]